jgi:hypothetical protein
LGRLSRPDSGVPGPAHEESWILLPLFPPWPLSAGESFYATYAHLNDDSQETFDVTCALIARVHTAAGDIPRLPDMDLRMVKSRRYHWEERIYRPLRLYFAFEVDGFTAALLVVEEDDELADEIKTSV